MIVLNYINFRRLHSAHQTGLLPDDVYETDRAGVGFAFSSDVGFQVIDTFTSSGALRNEAWDIVRESAEQARAYCHDSQNSCLTRYEVVKNGPK